MNKKAIDREAPLRKEIANNFRRLLKEKKKTQVELSNATGIARSTLSDYARAATMMKIGNLEKIANFLGVDKSEIDPTFKSMKVVNFSNFTNVPIVGRISAGLPIFADENITGYMPVLDSMVSKDKEYFVLEVEGDSMNLEFGHGSLLLIEKTCEVENGQIGVIRVNGEDATVKKISYNENSITLIPMSSNPAHLPVTYNEERHEVAVVGRIIQATKIY